MKKSTLAIVLAFVWGLMEACGAAAKDGTRDEAAGSRVLQQEERSDTETSEKEAQLQEAAEADGMEAAAGGIKETEAGRKAMEADQTGSLADTGSNMGYSGNWENGLGREDENFTAEDWSLLLSLDEPAVLEIESVTESGNLDISVLYSDGSVYYRVEGVGTGCSYAGLDQPGSYVISIWAEEHNGSFSFRLDPVDIDEKLEKLTAHLPFIKDMKTEEGKKVVWGIDELGKAEIEGKDCYLLDLQYADEGENGVMAGRRLGSYAFSRDGEQYYELNAAEDSWNRI